MQHFRLQLTLGQFFGLVAICAFFAALLFTPGAPLVGAVAVVLPGFLIERRRGGSGIAGGTISSGILTAIWGFVDAYTRGRGSFLEMIEACPFVYLLFVLSLFWGALAATTLHFTINAFGERRRRMAAHPRRRIQFTLRQLMGLVLVCGVVFALLSTPIGPIVAAIVIVLPGFVIDRWRGGNGTFGGMVSATLALVFLQIATFAYYAVNPNPVVTDYLGPFLLALVVIVIGGIIWGAMSSALFQLVILMAKTYTRKQRPEGGRRPGSLTTLQPGEDR
jgi:hypothetical protein